jgi:hypothetical protein
VLDGSARGFAGVQRRVLTAAFFLPLVAARKKSENGRIAAPGRAAVQGGELMEGDDD